MKISHTAALVLSGVLALPAFAQMKVLELGHEASPSMVTLPSSETGELILKKCAACTSLRLRATAKTQYVIDKQPVSLAEFKRFVEQSPPRMYMVMQINHTTQLGRILAESARRGPVTDQ